MKITILNQDCLNKDVLLKIFHPIEVQTGRKMGISEIFNFERISKGINKEEILSMIPLTILLEHESSLVYLRQIFYNSTLLDDTRMLWRVSLLELKKVKKRIGNNKKYLQSVIDSTNEGEITENAEKGKSKFILDLWDKINLLDEFVLALVEVCTDPDSQIVHYINQEF